jgi:hypothetical protein
MERRRVARRSRVSMMGDHTGENPDLTGRTSADRLENEIDLIFMAARSGGSQSRLSCIRRSS